MLRLRALLMLSMALAAYSAGCAPQEEEAYRTLTMSTSLTEIEADGEISAELVVNAVESDGKPGSGWVVLLSKHGQMTPYGLPEATVELVKGEAILRYDCDAGLDSKCEGSQRIRAVWKDTGAGVSIVVRKKQ
ncbi:MAG: hypothetical protein HY901_03040 [Deltaproteobacteria bacterium]|nr:hypothetical protein [Deltaproteobacteria bacterium]